MTNSYTIDNGLPSNHIYETLEGKDGFLWVATNNGISRFDGKRFVNYTTKDGLPSNDVLQVRKEKDGTIWVNCYKQAPSYFDEKLNRFISFENDKRFEKFNNKFLVIACHPFSGLFYRTDHTSIYINKRKIESSFEVPFNNLFIGNEQFRVSSNKQTHNEEISSFFITNAKTGSKQELKIKYPFYKNVHTTIINDKIFLISENLVKIITFKSFQPLQMVEQEIFTDESIKWHSFSNEQLIVFTKSGTILFYDLIHFKLKQTLHTNTDVNYVSKDKKGTIWVSTISNGLLKYSNSPIKKLKLPSSISTNFLSIYFSDENKMLAGNFQGEVLEENKIQKVYRILDQKNTTWIRAIASFENKIVTISDYNYAINFDKNYEIIFRNGRTRESLKTSLRLNDSILIIGANGGLYKLNVQQNKHQALKGPVERILSLAKINETSFYYLANSGIVKYNYTNHTSELYFSINQLKGEKISGITKGKGDRLWCYTAKSNIYLLENSKLKFSIKSDEKLPINISKLLEIDDNLWIASKEGVYVLNSSQLPKINIHKFTKSDGLNSNFVNDLALKNDSIYLATSDGICVISKHSQNIFYTIHPKIISTKINNKKVLVQSNYELNEDQKNVVFELAGIDLTGHLSNFNTVSIIEIGIQLMGIYSTLY